MIPLSFVTALLVGLNPAVFFDSPSCAIQFSIYNAGFQVEGSMQVSRVEIKFDPRSLDKSQVMIVVDPSSVNTGIAIRDRHLTRGDFFDIKKYPEILLRSKNFHKKSKSGFVGIFDVTIKSITKEIVIPFTMEKKEDGSHYNARFLINRLDFKVGEESVTIDNEVEIFVTVID